MSNEFQHEYECEECEGTFLIKPDMDEEIKFCPQCGHNKIQNVHNIITHEDKEEEDIDAISA